MPSDPRTALASNCDDCGLLVSRAVDHGSLLGRLPPELWNRARPTAETIPPLTGADPVFDYTPFGPLAGDETLQWNISRIVAEEATRFVEALDIAQADQLAIGRASERDGALATECHHARGADLDRLGEAFGVGRPRGFTDCCYWRLVTLILFQRGSTTWRLLDLAELYTGVRPAAVEGLKTISLVWPDPPGAGESFFDRDFLEQTASFGGVSDEPRFIAGYFDNDFWDEASDRSIGFGLHLAVERAKPAGTAVFYVNEPQNGRGGCLGATSRGFAAEHSRVWGG